jgi:superfamily II DNA or RNA helicase
MIELLRGGPIEVPAGDEAELRELLARLPAAAWSADELLPELGAPRPRLAVAPGPGAEAACAVSFDYGAGEPVAPERASLVVETPDGARRRDLEAERRYLAEFIEAGGKRARGQRAEGAHGTVNAGRLPELARALVASGWLVEAEGRRMRRAGATSVSVKSGVDWFELDGEVAFGDQTARFPELLRAVRDGTQRVQLGDGSIGLLPEDWLASWGLVEFADDAGDGRLLFRGNQGWLLDALLAEREGVECDARFAAYRERLASFRGVRPQREPRGFVGELRPYQRDGLGWFRFLRELGLGGCLADDMGLGKTVQVLALLEERRAEGGRRPSLVVAPRSLVFNWIDEAARFTPRLRVLDYTGTDRAARRAQAGEVDLLVTTYGTLRRDAVQLADEEFDYVVLDEATAIKNAASQSAKASRLLRAEHRLALTGTPIENHLGELWSLFEFLNPGMLGRSKAFQRLTTPGEGGSGLGALARALRPFFLRRTKDEVLQDLPPKTEQIVLCELGRAERKRYDELRAHYRAVLLQGSAADESLGRMKIQVLEALLRLRQAACHPGLVDPARRGDGSAKLDALLPLLEELVSEGHKALVFSQFTSLLAIVRARLDAAGIVHEYLDGRTRDRKERVARFQSDPACPLFLISLKAGGHGLNLTASDYVFLLDPWWNPAVESQAIDRAHRIGQSRSVFAYRLIAKDTVEQRVLELQERKRELAEALLGQGPRVLKDLTRDDLEALLS